MTSSEISSVSDATVTSAELGRARQMFRTVFGPDYGEELCTQLGDGEFNQVLMCRIAPNIWLRDATPVTQKILCAIALCTAIQQDIRYFVRAAIHHGITRAQIEDVLLLAGLEAGFPAAGVARRALQDACDQHQAMLRRLGKPSIEW